MRWGHDDVLVESVGVGGGWMFPLVATGGTPAWGGEDGSRENSSEIL